jgi:hypothetical protein
LHALVCKFTARDYVAGMDTRERISVMEEPEQVHELAEAVQEEGKSGWAPPTNSFGNPYLALGIALAAGCAIAAVIRNRD